MDCNVPWAYGRGTKMRAFHFTQSNSGYWADSAYIESSGLKAQTRMNHALWLPAALLRHLIKQRLEGFAAFLREKGIRETGNSESESHSLNQAVRPRRTDLDSTLRSLRPMPLQLDAIDKLHCQLFHFCNWSLRHPFTEIWRRRFTTQTSLWVYIFLINFVEKNYTNT